ncbi:MAG: hypothetical protein ABIO72_06130 [Patescibacteria group bacterium]
MLFTYLIFLGAIVQIAGIVSYIRGTLKGTTKPNRVTWLMWAIAPMIAVLAALTKGVGWAVVPVFMSGFGPLLVFIASFVNRNSYWKLERFDYVCGVLSVLALILWGITKEPLVAIALAIASDAAAAVPTLRKAWSHPETERIGPFAGGVFGALTGFAAIRTWHVAEYGFLIYLVGMNCLLILFILRHTIFRQGKHPVKKIISSIRE